jgi:hypothetical protein
VLCWLAKFSEKPCEGRLRVVHLIDRQKLKQRGHDPSDPLTYVLACGGFGYGNAGHHGAFDARKLSVPRSALPAGLVELASELRLETWFDRRYPT